MTTPDARDWIRRGQAALERSRGADSDRENRDDLEKAADAFEQATRRDPALADGWLHLGRTRYSLKSHEAALAAFDEALRLSPDDAALWLERARTCARLDRHDEVREATGQVLRRAPEQLEAWVLRMTASARLGRHAETLEACEAILDRVDEPEVRGSYALELRTRWRLGGALAGLGESERAQSAFAGAEAVQARRWDWGSPDEYYEALGACEEACAVYEEKLSRMPDSVDKWKAAGETYRKAGRFAEALAAFSSATRLGDDPYAWWGLAEELARAHRLEEALEAFERARRHIPNRPPLLARIDEVREQLGRRVDRPNDGS